MAVSLVFPSISRIFIIHSLKCSLHLLLLSIAVVLVTSFGSFSMNMLLLFLCFLLASLFVCFPNQSNWFVYAAINDGDDGSSSFIGYPCISAVSILFRLHVCHCDASVRGCVSRKFHFTLHSIWRWWWWWWWKWAYQWNNLAGIVNNSASFWLKLY